MVSNVQELAHASPGHRQLHKQATCRQQPQSQGQPPPEHQVRPQPCCYKDPNPRASFRKGKQKLLRQYRPAQTGPKSNKATVADVQFLTAAKQRSLQDHSEARTAPLHPATPPALLHPGGDTAAHLGLPPSCTKCPGNKLVRAKQELETHCPYQPNLVPLSTITASFNPSLRS